MVRPMIRWAVVSFALLLLGVLSAGCSSTSIQGVNTVHNREATRVWVIRRTAGGSTHRDEVLYCDVQMLQSSGQLCQRWQ